MEEIRVENYVAMEKSIPKRRIVQSDGALYVLLLIAVIGVIVAGNTLGARGDLPRLIVQVSLYVILLLLGYLTYRYCLIAYRYTLTERMLRVDRLVGKKERAEENVHLSDIAWIRRTAECGDAIGKAHGAYTGSRKRTLAVHVRGAAEYTLLLSASEDFTGKLIRQWKTARK